MLLEYLNILWEFLSYSLTNSIHCLILLILRWITFTTDMLAVNLSHNGTVTTHFNWNIFC